jgi:tetratricopeptide (TPR) repeat protein
MEQLGIYLSRTQTEIHQQVIAEMDNGLYLLELGIERQAEELNKQIEQVVRQEIKKELQGRIQETAEKETAIQWQGVWLIGEQKRTGRGSWQAKAAMAVIGVILLMAGLQLYSSYHASKRNKDNGIKVEDVVIDLAADSRLRPIASAELPAEMKEWLEAGEVAEQQIEAGNKQALLVRAKAFEQLLLLEDAKQDYEQYLKEYPNDREISKQLRQLDRKLAKQVAPPLSPYQKLQVAIDEYLTASRTSNGEAVNKASSEMAEIAEEIKAKGDSLGIDLVSYYSSVSIEQLEPLQQARNLRREVEFGDATDRLDELTLKAEQAKKVFEQLEARLEVELTNVELIRCLNRKRQMQMVEPLLNTGIRYAIDNHYIFLHSRFLTLQGELYSNLGNYSATITTFESAINVATPLGTPELFLRPSLWLAMINTTINNNILTFQQAYNTVLLARGLDRPIYEIQPITLLGISANVLKYSSIAERYFQRAIKLANRQNNYSYSALAHAYLGLVRVEQKRFQEAENEFFQAHITSNKLTDIGAQTYARFLVTAYQARAMKLMGKLDYAIELYQTALSLAEKANIFKELILSLILSQLHQGLGECYMEKRNRDAAETEMVASLQLADEAKKKFQTGNPFLTFATTTKTSREQLEFIRCCFKE